MADDEAAEVATLATLPSDVQAIIASKLNVSSLANLNLTCAANRTALVANDAVWANLAPPNCSSISDYASLKQHILAAKQLATANPAVHMIHHFQEHMRGVCFAPAATDAPPTLVAWCSGGAAVVPDITKPNRQCLLLGSDRPIVSCQAIASDDDTALPHIASICTDGALRYAAVVAAVMKSRVAPLHGPVHCTHHGINRLWNLATASPEQAEPDLSGEQQRVSFAYPAKTMRTATALSRCMCTVTTTSGVRLLATGHADSAVRLWSLHPLFPGPSKPMATALRGHGVAVAQLTHHPAIGLLSGGLDCKVKLWDVDAGRCVTTFKLDASPPSPHLLVLTNGALHRLDPRAPPPPTPARSTILTTPGFAQCMSSVVDHTLALGHSRGAALHDLRACGGKPMLRVAQGHAVFDLHLDRLKLVAQGGAVRGSSSGTSVRDVTLTVCALPEGVASPVEGVVGQTHMTAMACRGARVVVGTLLGGVAVHDYGCGQLGGSLRSGRSKFWQSPSASDDEDDDA